MAHPTAYKPSPLSFGSPRTSPFRRPDSPASPLRAADSPSSTIRPATPTKSLSTPTIPQTSPSKTHESTVPPTTTNTTPKTTTSTDAPWTPRGLPPPLSSRPAPTSPTRTSSAITAIHSTTNTTTRHNQTIPAPTLHSLRETFHLLDRDSDNLISRPDLTSTLTDLSLPTTPSDLLPFFPPGTPQSISLPNFLSTLSNLLAPLSSQQELVNAFAAFDERDSGEIDVGELRDAVMHTAPEGGGRVLSAREVDEVVAGFVGRRAFGKGNPTGGRGEVFRYREWVGGVMGVGEEGKKDEGAN